VTSLVVNGYYDFTTSGIEPYLTAGIGGAKISTGDWTIWNEVYTSLGNTTKLAYQLGAGLCFPTCVCKLAAIDVIYQYFSTTEVTEGNQLKYTPSSNSILVGLRVGF